MTGFSIGELREDIPDLGDALGGTNHKKSWVAAMQAMTLPTVPVCGEWDSYGGFDGVRLLEGWLITLACGSPDLFPS